MNASGYQNNRNWWSARQRVVVLTFTTPGDAAAWDAAGQPLAIDKDTVELTEVLRINPERNIGLWRR